VAVNVNCRPDGVFQGIIAEVDRFTCAPFESKVVVESIDPVLFGLGGIAS
jgi:hypothetical protein